MNQRKVSNTLLIVICALIAVIVIGVIVLYNTPIFHNLENIGEPEQRKCDYELVETSVERKLTKVTKVAKYKIAGRVLATCDYFPIDIKDKISIKDVVIAWGLLVKDENYDKFSIINVNNRKVFWKMDQNLMDELGGENSVLFSFSNNHLIYSNQEIRDQLAFVTKDDYIEIEGYLVNVDFEQDGLWNTSLTRTDTGNDSGEIIYVESLKWLKKSIQK